MKFGLKKKKMKRAFKKNILKARMETVRPDTYEKYLKFLTELPEYINIEGFSMSKHCSQEKVSSNTNIVMKMCPVNLFEKGTNGSKYNLKYTVNDIDFKVKARRLAAAVSLYGEQDTMYKVEKKEVEKKEVTIKPNQDSDSKFKKNLEEWVSPKEMSKNVKPEKRSYKQRKPKVDPEPILKDIARNRGHLTTTDALSEAISELANKGITINLNFNISWGKKL